MSSSDETMSAGDSKTVQAGSVVIRVESGDSTVRSVGRRMLVGILMMSIVMNVMFLLSTAADSGPVRTRVTQEHHSGNKASRARLAVISFSGAIMPPSTERWLAQIKKAGEDDNIKGVLLAVDSPGGLVADSHQIYHALEGLREKKPVYVAMQRLAASGGYYLAMGIGPEGRIFVEPTTWTGSIGVIVPRYNVSDLADRFGVKVEPLVTGPLKDTLNPFREMTDQERAVWDDILADSFDRFVTVIADNRSELSEEQVRELATGQIYTADQALENGLADEMGYEKEALDALAASLGLSDYEAVEYSSPQSLMDVLMNGRVQTSDSVLQNLLSAGVPKAMYYCSWNPWVPAAM